VVPYSRELDEVLELRMTEHLSRYRIPPRVRDNTLRLAVLVLLDLDYSGRERLLEFLLMFPWNGAAESDMG